MFFNKYLNCFTWSSNQLLNLSIYLSTRFLCVLTIESSATQWLTGLTNLFSQFLAVFCSFWMLVTFHKLCHVPHASRITTRGTTFTERIFSASKEWVKSWPHAFLITYDKTFTKKLLAVRPEKVKRREKKDKTRKAITKLFASNANAVMFNTDWSIIGFITRVKLFMHWCYARSF